MDQGARPERRVESDGLRRAPMACRLANGGRRVADRFIRRSTEQVKLHSPLQKSYAQERMTSCSRHSLNSYLTVYSNGTPRLPTKVGVRRSALLQQKRRPLMPRTRAVAPDGCACASRSAERTMQVACCCPKWHMHLRLYRGAALSSAVSLRIKSASAQWRGAAQERPKSEMLRLARALRGVGTRTVAAMLSGWSMVSSAPPDTTTGGARERAPCA